MDFMLYRTASGPVAVAGETLWHLSGSWDDLVNDDNLHAFLVAATSATDGGASPQTLGALAPIESQEVWAAGVTYFRSRVARMEESQAAGGGDFYQRVYDAERPEIFFKATASRVVGNGQAMCLRSDSSWIVPEPELVLVVTRNAHIVGYTIGNDLSCRDIEGENPLYLPQAKTFDRCAALGPGILVPEQPPSPDTRILLSIERDGGNVFEGEATLSQMKRRFEELVGFLFCSNSHPQGCMLMTGTGIVPPDDVSLIAGDIVHISIDGIGTLNNPVA